MKERLQTSRSNHHKKGIERGEEEMINSRILRTDGIAWSLYGVLLILKAIRGWDI